MRPKGKPVRKEERGRSSGGGGGSRRGASADDASKKGRKGSRTQSAGAEGTAKAGPKKKAKKGEGAEPNRRRACSAGSAAAAAEEAAQPLEEEGVAPKKKPRKKKEVAKGCLRCGIDDCTDCKETFVVGFSHKAASWPQFVSMMNGDKDLEKTFESAHRIRMGKGDLAKSSFGNPMEVVEGDTFKLRVTDAYYGPTLASLRQDFENDPGVKKLPGMTMSDLPAVIEGQKKGVVVKDGNPTKYELVREFSISKNEYKNAD